MHKAAAQSSSPSRNFGLIASRISKMMIHVAEAAGLTAETLLHPSDLVSTPQDLLCDDRSVPWKDLTTLADRIAAFLGNNEEALADFGRSYYQHLEHLPYTRLASNVLTLRGALYLAQRYTTPHNYEALICTSQWLSRTECIKTNRLKYPADPVSAPICHITRGILEYFPTLFGREPMARVEMEIAERHASYHFTLPPPMSVRKFFSRAFDSLTVGKKNWEILREQETRLIRSQWDARRRQGILDELLSRAPQPLALLENGKPVFLNNAVSLLLAGEAGLSRIPFQKILKTFEEQPESQRKKFSVTTDGGTSIPLEAILSARLKADSFGSEMTLLRFRDRRIPETREEAVNLAREQERANFSRDLHDGLGQTLSGIAYRIAALRQSQPDNNSLAELEGGIRSALAQARTIAHDLDLHSDLTLIEKLRLTTTGFSGLTNVPISFAAENTTEPAPAVNTHEVDMILREALANAIRHSKASEITVFLKSSEKHIEMDIRDNGTGFSQDQAQGFGMKSILKRAATLKGNAEWLHAAPGTLLRCTFPISIP